MGDPAYEALEQSESELSGARLTPRYFWAPEPVDGERIYYDFMRATANEKSLKRELERIAALRPDILKTYVRLGDEWEEQGDRRRPRDRHPVVLALHVAGAAVRAGRVLALRHPAAGLPAVGVREPDQLRRHDPALREVADGAHADVDDRRDDRHLPRHPRRPADAQAAQPLAVQRAAEPGQHGPSRPPSRVRRPQVHARTTCGSSAPAGSSSAAPTSRSASTTGACSRRSPGSYRFGFTPYEALRTVTALPPKVMGVEADMGTVEEGKARRSLPRPREPVAGHPRRRQR